MPQRETFQGGQDWGSVNVGSTTRRATTGTVSTEKRYGAGGNSKTFTAMSARKLEEATDVGTLAKVDKSLSKAIMQARTSKKWSQKDLATRINAKPQIVAEYESGKAIPNPQIISKLERALGTKLPRGGSKSKAPGRASTGGVGMSKTAAVTRGGPAKRR